jgi:hypothetical protein
MVLKAARRKKLKSNQFGLPGSRKYPMDTKARAINAKARATQAVKKGRMSPSTAGRIKAKANRVIARKGKRK